MSVRIRGNPKRVAVVALATIAALSMFWAWRAQVTSRLSCPAVFEPMSKPDGYLRINILGPHATEEMFEAELFIAYAANQHPQRAIRILRLGAGAFAPESISSDLVPFDDGVATPAALKLSLPTPGISQRRFPFDSPDFDIKLKFEPAIRPKGVIIRNLSPDFIPKCGTMTSQWNGQDQLDVKISFQRNPFVQVTATVMALAVALFAVLLVLVRKTEELVIATASFFISMWSIRGIIVPTGLMYSTLLDLWMMSVSLVALFVVLWRLTKPRLPA